MAEIKNYAADLKDSRTRKIEGEKSLTRAPRGYVWRIL